MAHAGNYAFEVFTAGTTALLIDGKTVVEKHEPTRDPSSTSGEIQLEKGIHRFELEYNWRDGPGDLEVYWTPPGAQKSLIGPDVLSADGGAWLPGSIQEPPAYKLPPETQPDQTQP